MGALSTEHPLRTGSGQSAIGTWCSSVVQPSTGTWCDQGGSLVRDPSSAGGTAVARRTVGSGQRASPGWTPGFGVTGPGGGGLGGDQGRRGMKWGDGGWRVSRGTHPQTGTYLGTCSLVAAIMHSMLPIVRPLSQVQTIQMDAGSRKCDSHGRRLTVDGRSSQGERGLAVVGCGQLSCVFVRAGLRHKLRQRRPNSESEGGLGLALRWQQN